MSTFFIHTLLTFNGNCRQAMQFYQKCLGGRLQFQTIGESPLSSQLSSRMKKYIVQATLTGKQFVLMGSDLTSDQGLIRGNAVTLSLHLPNPLTLKTTCRKLSSGGTINVPLQRTHWNTWSVELRDKFGNYWVLNSLNK